MRVVGQVRLAAWPVVRVGGHSLVADTRGVRDVRVDVSLAG